MKLHLAILIEEKRGEMIESGLINGFSNQDTVKLSQELDELLNVHYQIDDGLIPDPTSFIKEP
ncbi:aspartyl-phosphate phosphatase Spo0E family protein [Falsibacillus albus]|nr:aspartyl-phosphate phosphatase Spo0E family protein [Falsibacillus albus]